MMFGWLMMLVVVGLPVLLAVGLLVGAFGFLKNQSIGAKYTQNQPTVNQPDININQSSQEIRRYCSHCGAGLQSDWTHCPQCGSPIP